LLSLGPALAPVTLGPARTVLTGGLAIVLSLLLAIYDGTGFSLHAVVAVATIIGVTAAGVVASAARQRKEHELVNVRAVADVTQRVLLRQVPRRVGPIQIAVRYISAAAAARIGGDLYDVVTVPGTARLIVADVQGKGLAAVQTAAVVLAAFRGSAYDAPDLAAIAEHIELSLDRQAPGEEFVTAVMAEIDPECTEIRLLNCGHPPPLLLSGGLARLAEPLEAALPLGLARLAPGERKEHTVPFGPGDRMLFYTDGISEARDKSGAFYPLDGCGALLGGPDPDAALDRLYDDVLSHVGGRLQDDSAALFVVCQPPDHREPADHDRHVHAPASVREKGPSPEREVAHHLLTATGDRLGSRRRVGGKTSGQAAWRDRPLTAPGGGPAERGPSRGAPCPAAGWCRDGAGGNLWGAGGCAG
jgi:serine phosphatase RsbU (regulator of sigma subunit)